MKTKMLFTAMLFTAVAQSQVPGYVPQQSNLAAFYSFDAPLSTAAIVDDATSNNNNGTITGATQTNGQINNAYNFAPGNGIAVASSASLGSTGGANFSGLTISAWINPTNLSNFPFIVDKNYDDSYYLQLRSDGTIEFGGDYGGATPGPNNIKTAPGVIQVNSCWQHIVATFDENTKTIVIYVDNVVEFSGAVTVGTIGQDASFLSIGRGVTGGNQFIGLIDEVGIWNIALTQADVDALYGAGPHIPDVDAGIDQTILIPQCASLNGSASDGISPYSYSWNPGGAGQSISPCPAPAGFYDYVLTVTDATGCTNTDSVTVKAIDCIYELPSQEILCSETNFCVSLNAELPVPAGIIGMNICVTYDPSVMMPSGSGTGVATLGPVVTNGGSANSYISFDPSGELNISIYYDDPSPSEFDQIIGNIVCIPFDLVPGSGPASVNYSICAIDEGTLVTVNPGCIPDPATLTIVTDLDVAGIVQHRNLQPLTGGGPEVPATIVAADNTCIPFGTAVQTDGTGMFSLNVTGATNYTINRDISNSPAPIINGLINGADALWVNEIATKNTTNVPNVYTIIAADVNMDGLVRANDATLILTRAVLSINEFPQAWNYVGGNPPAPGNLSFDWLFFDASRLATDADFTIDASYPNSSGTGFSRDLIPNVNNNCLPINFVTNGSCVITPDVTIQGVLLGDLDGSWAPVDAIYAKSDDEEKTVYYDLQNAINQNGNLLVPVYVSSNEEVSAIDFTLDYDQNKVSVITTSKSGNAESTAITYNWNDYQSDILLVSSYTTTPISTGTSSTLFYIEISTTEMENLEANFATGVISYINGKEVSSVVIPRGGIANIEAPENNETVQVFPNPTNGVFNLVIPAIDTQATIRVFDLQGKEIYSATTSSSANQISLEHVEKGIYIVRVEIGTETQHGKIIIQ